MWVGRRGSGSWATGTLSGRDRKRGGKRRKKVKSILWYSLGPRTALVATATAAVVDDDDDDDGETESVCAAKNWCAAPLLEDIRSTSSVPVTMHALIIMLYCIIFLIAVTARANAYWPLLKDVKRACNPLYECIQEQDLLSDDFLRILVNQLGNNLNDADSYLSDEYPEKAKELPMELPTDYDSMDTLNPNPSIRDQEYLQHSTLWSHRFDDKNTNNKGYNRHRIQSGLKGLKDEKAENPLPAYCTPPNPCPVGYTSENNCLTDFENTAAFSRDYQSAQDCMCDTEHMLECSNDSGSSNSLSNMHISNSDLNQIVEQFQDENPFFQGEKLPIAAKKGIHVID